MYAIVRNNAVLVGPKEWDRAFFTLILKREGINNVTLPKSPYDSFPQVIDANTVIHKVTINRDEFNPLVQYLRGPLFTITANEVIADYKVTDTEIQFARNNFKDLAAAERYKKEISGITTTIQGLNVSITTARGDREEFLKKAVSITDTAQISWKFKEGWVQLSKADLLNIASLIDSHVQASFDWEKAICDQIDAANSSGELLAIKIVEETDPVTPLER